MLNKDSRIFVAGHKGMVGSSIMRQLQTKGYQNLMFADRNSLDLTNQAAVRDFMQANKPEAVYLAAARVGGIHANNTYPAEFIYQNLMIEANIIHEAFEVGVKKLLFLGSSCIYPKLSEQPIQESSLMTGILESTNEPYAIAKIAGIKLCESYNRQYGVDFRSAMPTNLYGQYDNFHPENSHVIPALIRRFHQAKLNNDREVLVWGSGKPKREFLHVDDLANAALFIMHMDHERYTEQTQPTLSHINVGTGEDCSIAELAQTVADVVGYQGQIVYDTSKPDGTPRKLLDVSLLGNLGWKFSISLEDGLKSTYDWFCDNEQQLRI